MTSTRSAGVLITLWLLTVVISSQFLMITPLLSDIGKAYAVGEAQLGLLASSYALAVSLVCLIAGPISDRIGRRNTLRIGSIAMTAALLLHGLAHSFAALILLRALAGVAGGFVSVWAAYVGDLYPYQQRGRAMGIAMSGMAFGQIAGVPLGVLLAGSGGLMSPFLVFGGLMLVVALLTWTTLPEPTQGDRAAGGIAAAWRTYVDLMRRRDVQAMAVASLLMMSSVSVLVVFLPTWLQETLGGNSRDVASLFAVGGVANAIAGPLAGWASDRWGRKRLVIAAGIAMSVMLPLMSRLSSLTAVHAAFFVVMACAGIRMSPLQTLVSALVDASRRGALLSLSLATGQAGFAMGSALAGTIYLRAGFTGNASLSAVGGLLAALVVGVGLPEPSAGPAPLPERH